MTKDWIPDQVGNDEKRNDFAFRHTREGGYPTEPSVFQQAAKVPMQHGKPFLASLIVCP